MTLRRRMQVMAVLVVTSLVVVLLLTASAFLETKANGEAAVTRLQPAAEASADLLVGTADMERGVSTYVETGQSGSLGPYAEGRSVTGVAIPTLRENLADSGQQINDLVNRTAMARELWISEVAQPIIAAVRNGSPAKAQQIQTSIVSAARFEILRALELTLDAEIDRQLEVRFNAMDDAADSLAWCLAALTVLIALILFIVIWRFRIDVLNPLYRLRNQMQTVAGDRHINSPITSSGPPEMRDVGDDAERMRRRLVEKIDEAKEAREETESEAPVVNAMRGALEAKNPAVIGATISGDQQAAEGLKGDWWEVIPLADGRGAIIVTDISGHGWQAGISGLRLKDIVVDAITSGGSIEAALQAGVELFEAPDSLFATMAIVVIDPSRNEIEWANAGHLNPLIMHSNLHFTELEMTGPLLSTLGGVWSTRKLPLASDDFVVLWTDGVTESHDEDGEQLEDDGLQALLIEAVGAVGRDPAALVPYVVSQARARAVDWDRDDATLIIGCLTRKDQIHSNG